MYCLLIPLCLCQYSLSDSLMKKSSVYSYVTKRKVKFRVVGVKETLQAQEINVKKCFTGYFKNVQH